MAAIVFRNAALFGGESPGLLPRRPVAVQAGKIEKIVEDFPSLISAPRLCPTSRLTTMAGGPGDMRDQPDCRIGFRLPAETLSTHDIRFRQSVLPRRSSGRAAGRAVVADGAHAGTIGVGGNPLEDISLLDRGGGTPPVSTEGGVSSKRQL